MKNYIGFANDHSGSMGSLARAALADFNTNSTAIKDAATREMLDTIVSVVGFGTTGPGGITREIVNSNPHVLKPMSKWLVYGNTPLWDAVGDLIEQFENVPDYKNPDVSFLILVTTDGGENGSRRYDKSILAEKIRQLSQDGRWTFVFRMPRGGASYLNGLGIPSGNIQEWETTSAGMAASTVATRAAIDQFYTAKASGQKSSGVFYANAAHVDPSTVKATLVDISSELNVWSVLPEEDGIEIKPFAEKKLNSPLLKGAAFYQLTKTEARVQDTKMIMIRDKTSGRVYFGPAARQMIGLPATGTVRLKVGDHGNYDLFIQSTSTNRKLVAGSIVLYWAKVGTAFKPEDQPWLNQAPKAPVAAPQAPQATAGITPVVSPAPVVKQPVKAPAANGARYFPSREDARRAARKEGKRVIDTGNKAFGQRWIIV